MTTETIDIESVVSKVKTGFVTFLTRLIVTEAITLLPWLGFFEKILYETVEWAVNLAATKGGLVAFMINTKVIAIDKGTDYVRAIEVVEQLPDDVDNETWEKAEREAAHQFKNLFNLAS